MFRISFSKNAWTVTGKKVRAASDCDPVDDVTGYCLPGLLVAFRIKAAY